MKSRPVMKIAAYGIFADPIVSYSTRALGGTFQVATMRNPVTADDPDGQRLRRIGDRLLQASDEADSEGK